MYRQQSLALPNWNFVSLQDLDYVQRLSAFTRLNEFWRHVREYEEYSWVPPSMLLGAYEYLDAWYAWYRPQAMVQGLVILRPGVSRAPPQLELYGRRTEMPEMTTVYEQLLLQVRAYLAVQPIRTVAVLPHARYVTLPQQQPACTAAGYRLALGAAGYYWYCDPGSGNEKIVSSFVLQARQERL